MGQAQQLYGFKRTLPPPSITAYISRVQPMLLMSLGAQGLILDWISRPTVRSLKLILRQSAPHLGNLSRYTNQKLEDFGGRQPQVHPPAASALLLVQAVSPLSRTPWMCRETYTPMGPRRARFGYCKAAPSKVELQNFSFMFFPC